MDVKSNSKVIPKTLAELIAQEMPKESLPLKNEVNDYELYPEEDGTDLKKNPYSRV